MLFSIKHNMGNKNVVNLTVPNVLKCKIVVNGSWNK